MNQEIFVDDIRQSVFEYYTFLWNDYLKDFEDEIKYPNPNKCCCNNRFNDYTIFNSSCRQNK